MTTKHPRLNVTLSPEHLGMLSFRAKKKSASLSAMARELIEIALELEEDYHLSQLANEREKTHTKWVSHHDAWK
jgi:predicted DNA-binding protein